MEQFFKSVGIAILLVLLVALIVAVVVFGIFTANIVYSLAFAVFNSKLLAYLSAIGAAIIVLNLASLSKE
ncbi:hypothetical protein [uncultured Vagococcus sp.]|uniref:hypothetical protein n=1 Tax=uncultured Vagococcus sp. TaxID=189676 RepID=UPI0025871ACD|nr:hypothetical protein [uncultured Vagococcus sp.]